MASGSFGVATSNKYISGTLSWSSSTVIPSNGSNVYFELRFSRTNSGYTTHGTGSWQVWINGELRDSGSKAYSFTQNSNTLVHYGTVWVPHNSDGNKQVLIEVDGWTDTHDVYYANSSPWLDYIPRASTFNGGIDWTAGVDNFWISIDRKDASFHHTVQMYVQHTYDGNWDFVGERTWVGDSGWWNPTVAEITQIYTTNAGYENRPMLIRVYTYDAGHTVQIGDYQDKVGTVRAYATGKPSVNNFNIGTTSVPVSIVNHNANFTYDAVFTFGSFSKTFSSVAKDFNMTFSAADITSMYGQCTDATSKVGKVTIHTKYNGVRIEDGVPDPNYKDVTLSVVNSNPVFSTIQYADINTAITAITGNNQYIVQNKSTVQAKVLNANKAVGQNQATITKYVATLNGVTLTVTPPFATDIVFDFGVVNAALNINLQITAYDSRGLTTVVTKAVNIVPWQLPLTNVSAPRENGFGSAVTLSLSGSISPVNVAGVNKNALVASGVNYRTRPVGGTWSSTVQFNSQALTMPNFTTANVALTMDTTTAYEIEVQVTDKFGSKTIALTVAIGIPLAMLDEVMKSLGIGKFPSRANALDVAGQVMGEKDALEASDMYKKGGLETKSSTLGKPAIGFNLDNSMGAALYYDNGNSRIPFKSYDSDSNPKAFLTMSGVDSSANSITNVDLNNLKETGFFMGEKLGNAPINAGVTGSWFYVTVVKHNNSFVYQEVSDFFNDLKWSRRCENGTWKPWIMITGKPLVASLASGGKQYLASGSWYRLDWVIDKHNEGSFVDLTINQIYAQREGYYLINFWTYFQQSVGTGFYVECWNTSGDTNFSATSIISTWAPANGWNYYHGSNVVYLRRGHYYELVIRHSDGSYTRETYDVRAQVIHLGV